jgi:hypothetical protein
MDDSKSRAPPTGPSTASNGAAYLRKWPQWDDKHIFGDGRSLLWTKMFAVKRIGDAMRCASGGSRKAPPPASTRSAWVLPDESIGPRSGRTARCGVAATPDYRQHWSAWREGAAPSISGWGIQPGDTRSAMLSAGPDLDSRRLGRAANQNLIERRRRLLLYSPGACPWHGTPPPNRSQKTETSWRRGVYGKVSRGHRGRLGMEETDGAVFDGPREVRS